MRLFIVVLFVSGFAACGSDDLLEPIPEERTAPTPTPPPSPALEDNGAEDPPPPGEPAETKS